MQGNSEAIEQVINKYNYMITNILFHFNLLTSMYYLSHPRADCGQREGNGSRRISFFRDVPGTPGSSRGHASDLCPSASHVGRWTRIADPRHTRIPHDTVVVVEPIQVDLCERISIGIVYIHVDARCKKARRCGVHALLYCCRSRFADLTHNTYK